MDIPVDLVVDDSKNQIIQRCLDYYGYDKTLPVEERFNGFPFNSASSCMLDTKLYTIYIPQNKATEAFLKANPHYRYPGMALPNGKIGRLSPCWGKDRRYHLEQGC